MTPSKPFARRGSIQKELGGRRSSFDRQRLGCILGAAAHCWQSYLFAYISGAAWLSGTWALFLHNVVGGNWGVAVPTLVDVRIANAAPHRATSLIPISSDEHASNSWTPCRVRAAASRLATMPSYMEHPVFDIGRTIHTY